MGIHINENNQAKIVLSAIKKHLICSMVMTSTQPEPYIVNEQLN